MQLKLLTYNVHLFGGTAPGLHPQHRYREKQRCKALIERLGRADSDVLCLNEVWAPQVARRITRALAAQYPFAHRPGPARFVRVGSGLLVLSKWPLSKTTFTPFRKLSGTDALSHKGVCSFELTPPGHAAIRLMMSHLQAGNHPVQKRARRSNLRQLIELAKPQPPHALLGDLNVPAEERSLPTGDYRHLCSRLSTLQLVDTFRTLHPSAEVQPGASYDGTENSLLDRFNPGDAALQHRLDYIFARSDVRLLNASMPRDYLVPGTEDDISDHYPVELLLELP